MRKRRRLANKMTIMVCAVLLAVSAFFYAPMEAHAAVNLTGTGSYASSTGRYFTVFKKDMGDFIPSTGLSGIESDAFYQVKITTDISISSSQTINFSNISCTFGNFYAGYIGTVDASKTASASTARTFYMKGSELLTTYGTNLRGTIFLKSGSLDTDLSMSVKFTVNSCVKQSVDAEEEYNKGYNAGYSAGEDAGYDSGYSTGYNEGYSAGQSSDAYNEGFQDGVDSVDTDSYYQSGYEAGENAGYNSGYEAGVDSVDTQSYYDAGYQAGYQKAYDLGYDTGYEEAYDVAYDAGYKKAYDEIAELGADSSVYPVYVSGKSDSDGYSETIFVDWAHAADVNIFIPEYDWFEINPNHTYKAVVKMESPTYLSNSSLDYVSVATCYCYFEIGGTRYALPVYGQNCEVYIPGDRMSTTYGLGAILQGVSTLVDSSGELTFKYISSNIDIYDCGPSGNTQNHIANQTDKLNENADKNTDTMVNGFDNSQGDSVNSDLSSGLDEYQTAEDSLWSTATTGLNDFTFFDIESVPAMVTGISFISATMTGWFNQAGGASGVGIVLSILFSVMLVAMVLGLYRWYQSRGGKD